MANKKKARKKAGAIKRRGARPKGLFKKKKRKNGGGEQTGNPGPRIEP